MVVRIHLRGVEPKDVEIMAAGKILTSRGKREQRSVDKDRDGFRREIHYASFEHSIELPEGVKPEEITASYRNGVLELTAPMPESAVGRKIAIELDSPSSTQNA
jgi:HSP20 family protein